MIVLYKDAMDKDNLPKFNFQTFYVSKEESNCSLISEIVRISKKFNDLNLSKNINQTVVSMRYLKRVLINADKCDFRNIKRDEFLEVVDYDPLKRVILIIGPKEPKIETPIHWLIYNARSEINTIIQINDEKLSKTLEKKLPTTEKEYPAGTLEQAKEVLKNLRNSKIVVIKNQGIISVGSNAKEAEDLMLKTLGS